MTDKIHPPTPRRRKQARERGRVAKCKTLVTASLLLAITMLLSWSGEGLAHFLMTTLERSLREPMLTLDDGEAVRRMAQLTLAAATLIVPILTAMMLFAIGANLIQTGLLWTPDRLSPSPERLSPAARLSELFSARSLGGFMVTLLKLFAIVATASVLVRSGFPEILRLGALPIDAMAGVLFGMLIRCCGWMGLTILAISTLDYALAWWQLEQSLRMTEQEFREEMRDLENGSVRYARSQAVAKV
ncbi:MAG: EscU/YscU/HrcU family type III secretion system export apparatus switch protein [Planctomycetota bacterium]